MTEQSYGEQYELAVSLPTILMFRPTRFEKVAPEKLDQWERALREKVGLPVTDARSTGIPSISFCDFADDCDSV